jgi:hypothetical protein
MQFNALRSHAPAVQVEEPRPLAIIRVMPVTVTVTDVAVARSAGPTLARTVTLRLNPRLPPARESPVTVLTS